MSSSEDQNLWKDCISPQEKIHHELLFYSQGPVDGYLSGERARDLFLHSRLPLTVLSQIWNLADVSNDNVLSVEEFVLAMHLILKVKDGLPIPRSLPKHLVPKAIPSPDVCEISDKERTAYQNVFNKISQDQIDAIQGRQLLLESNLPVEELSQVWDLSDMNRDGQLDRNEWNVSCHLVRHLKQGGKLNGPVNVFQLIPQCFSPVCYQARKHRVEEYNKKKHQLMTLKEKRKSQIDSESRRLELLKKRFALHKELYECSKSSEGLTVPEEEYNLYKEKEESNIEKVEAVIYRLKKEHENIRQQTVKAILGEQGSLQEDGRLAKLEQEEVRQKLATYHTKATKDPDPFHQLYELRRDQRKRSTLSEGEEPEVHFPFKTNPFNKESLQPKFSGQSIFVSPNPCVFNNNNSHKEAAIVKELCGFGDGFVEKWSAGLSDSEPGYDPIFMSLNVPMDARSWSGVGWSETGSKNVELLHQKLVDLKIEMQKLNDDNGGQLLFRNPEEYLARQKAQEEEEKLEKSRFQRRYASDKRSDKDVAKRKSYVPPRTVDDEAQKAAREYRQKRRSLNFDKRSDHSDKSNTGKASDSSNAQKHSSSEKKSNEKPLKIATDNTDSFSPESASSPRTSKTGPTSPRSTTSPPRPSTKRKAAPPPPISTSTSSAAPSVTPVSPSASTTESPSSPPVQQVAVEASSTKPVPQPRSPHSKIPKPVTNQESQNSKPSTPQNSSEPVSSVQGENKSSTPHEIQQPSRPPRRKNKSFLHESFEKEQNRKSKEIAVNVDIKNSPAESSVAISNVPESKPGDILPEPDSYNDKEDSLLDTIIKELPAFQREKPVKDIEINHTTKEEVLPVNGTVEEVIVANVDSNVECEIKPVKVDKPRGRLIESYGISKIEFTDKQIELDRVNVDDSDDEKELIINVQKLSYSERKVSLESDEPDGYKEHIKPVAYNKRGEDLQQAFEKIIAFPDKSKLKDTKDTLSIASDISVSSAGSEAPPLPDSAPPPLPCIGNSDLHLSSSLSEVNEVIKPEVTEKIEASKLPQTEESEKVEVIETIELKETKEVETNPEMSEIPEITEKASPREVVSPISDLKASMFSMRVTSPTRDMTGEIQTNGELTVDTDIGKKGGSSDSDMSDDEEAYTVTGTFTPGEKVTKDVPIETSEEDGGIQLISYNAKLNSPNSDQSGPDSAFEDMQSSMTSNDPLSNTIDEFSPEEYVTAEKVDKVESTPKMEGRSFVLEFDTDMPKSGPVLSPTGNKDFMVKAQQFADSVQRPPKMTVKLKREIQTPQDLTDERYLQLEAERRAVISSSTVKKKNVVAATYEEDATVDCPQSPEPEESIQEWRSEVSKRSNIPWEEKPDKVNLYSENIIQETENTEAVDRESIANLSKARQQWETKAQTTEDSTPRKQKQPQQVRHWEVKLPTPLKRVPADVVRTTNQDSDSESENMADTEYANESAIEREIRLAMEREELLKKEQEERANLQERQVSSVKKEQFEKIEQNNNKPTYHEMTEADRGSELQQREELIQQELQEQEEREAAYRGETRTYEDSSHSSADEDENANESIIEREIRLQQERERELEERRMQQARTNKQEPVTDDVVKEETVTVEYTEPVQSTPPSTLTETPVSTPDDLSEAEDQAEVRPNVQSRISYEEAISSAAHDGESLIARELREAREREEELHRQRQLLAAGNTSKPVTPKQTASTNVKEPVSNKTVDNQKATYQKDVSPFKHERRQSTDSLSSGHSSEKPQNVTPRSMRVTAFGGGGIMGNLTYETPDKPKPTKRQETPIEREIRLARERENEYRISKGLPPLKDEKKIDYDIVEDKEEELTFKKSSFFRPTHHTKGDNVQKFASSRLQKEINKQTALEKKYREEGKVISTSEDHLGLLKYSDIATQEQTAVPKRNFSITRKGASSAPISEQKQNGTAVPKSSSNIPEQPAPKFSRSTSSGGVTFSYKESRHKAESKIEQELREMREREEELRSQRAGSGLVSTHSPRSPDTTSVVNKRSQFEQTS
ncbi:titin homolog [Mercenaria mercenaria]|uniref:titin homolog n=1 Tax=Mercenaria mercenaria TaxID=6596 RepID=UPI00234FA089|nr:titin homolog [Mercenaria mercenaria]